MFDVVFTNIHSYGVKPPCLRQSSFILRSSSFDQIWFDQTAESRHSSASALSRHSPASIWRPPASLMGLDSCRCHWGRDVLAWNILPRLGHRTVRVAGMEKVYRTSAPPSLVWRLPGSALQGTPRTDPPHTGWVLLASVAHNVRPSWIFLLPDLDVNYQLIFHTSVWACGLCLSHMFCKARSSSVLHSLTAPSQQRRN